MGSLVEELIGKAQAVARAGDSRAAMAAADELVGRFPAEKRAWSFRAHLHLNEREYSSAISDLTIAVRISPHDRNEPYLYFFRGDCLMREGRLKEAVDDFTTGLQYCDLYEDDYYRETLYFFRAYTLIRLGKVALARLDLQRVDDSFQFWIGALRTKLDLVRECDQAGDHGY